MEAFDDSNALVYWRYVDPFWKLKRFLNIGSEAALKKKIKILDYFVHGVIRTKRELLEVKQDCDGRCANMDDILSNKYRVKKGDGVYYIAYAMGRKPYIWGEDAEEFHSKGWLKNGIFQSESPFKFVALHICIII
nr:cytochrome p450 [Quercus suber]